MAGSEVPRIPPDAGSWRGRWPLKTVRRAVAAVTVSRKGPSWDGEIKRAPARLAVDTALEEEYWSPTAVRAWRAWRWTDGVLHGVWKPWDSATLIAECSLCSSVPGADHTCGIYAFKEPSEVVAMTGGQSGLVIGRVRLSGLVIEHERGYRAEEVRMVELMAAPSIATAVQERYPDVPVKPRLLEGIIDG